MQSGGQAPCGRLARQAIQHDAPDRSLHRPAPTSLGDTDKGRAPQDVQNRLTTRPNYSKCDKAVTRLPHIPPNRRAVGPIMTKVPPLVTPGLPAGARNTTRTVRMGAWTFTPTDGHPIWGTHATLHDTDRRIALRHSAALLENLLTQLESIEANLGTDRSGPGAQDGHNGQLSRRAVHG